MIYVSTRSYALPNRRSRPLDGALAFAYGGHAQASEKAVTESPAFRRAGSHFCAHLLQPFVKKQLGADLWC